MNLAETYAAYCGCQINIPHLNQEEVSLPGYHYITLHSWCEKETNRRYAHWQAVVDQLNLKTKICIIQIGDKQDPLLKNVYDYRGTNTAELAFLMENSSCHVGYDSFPMHVASVYDTPIVAIFRNYIEQSYPVWSSKDRVKLLIPELTHSRPPYGNQELETAINKISPGQIVEHTIDLLKKTGRI